MALAALPSVICLMRVYRTTVSFVRLQVQLGHMLIAYLVTFWLPKRSKTIDVELPFISQHSAHGTSSELSSQDAVQQQ